MFWRCKTYGFTAYHHLPLNFCLQHHPCLQNAKVKWWSKAVQGPQQSPSKVLPLLDCLLKWLNKSLRPQKNWLCFSSPGCPLNHKYAPFSLHLPAIMHEEAGKGTRKYIMDQKKASKPSSVPGRVASLTCLGWEETQISIAFPCIFTKSLTGINAFIWG